MVEVTVREEEDGEEHGQTRSKAKPKYKSAVRGRAVNGQSKLTRMRPREREKERERWTDCTPPTGRPSSHSSPRR
jgi:hypothetical protein